MNKKKFFNKTKILVVFLIIFIVGILYYELFYLQNQREKETLNNNIEEIINETELIKQKIESYRLLETEIDAGKKTGTFVSQYNNEDKELTYLYQIMSDAYNYDFIFSNPEIIESEKYIRREVSINFECDNYSKAKNIIFKLIDSPYRTVIKNITMIPNSKHNISSLKEISIGESDSIKVSMNIIFIELNEKGD